MNTEQARFNMIKNQIHTWDVVNDRVLDLFFKVPREKFVPAAYLAMAFADMEIPLDHGQSMMSPKQEARIVQALRVQPNDKALVLGTNEGYLTALLAQLAQIVYSIDNVAEFTEQASHTFNQLHINNITLLNDNALTGWHKEALYDVIALTGSLPILTEQLKQALAVNGRLFAVLGDAPSMQATLVTRLNNDQWQVETLFETVRPRLADFKEVEQFIF